MLITLNIELQDNASVGEICTAITRTAQAAVPYIEMLGRPLDIDESINLQDEVGHLPHVVDALIYRSQ